MKPVFRLPKPSLTSGTAKGLLPRRTSLATLILVVGVTVNLVAVLTVLAVVRPTSNSEAVSRLPTPTMPISVGSLEPTPAWRPELVRTVPGCDTSLGEVWQPVGGSTATRCKASGLEMQQITGSMYAELDLEQVAAQEYPQVDFRATADVAFLNGSDIHTFAGLIVQTPKGGKRAGGYMLLVNANTTWQLKQVQSQTDASTSTTGQLGGVSGAVPGSLKLSVTVTGGVMAGYVNDQLIFRLSDTLEAQHTVMGLIVWNEAGLSSPVRFSNFELDAQVKATGTPSPTVRPPSPGSYLETTGSSGSPAFTDYRNAGGSLGPQVGAYTTIAVSCKLTGFTVADGDPWWYRLASSPWNNAYYAPADNFYNNGQTSGALAGTPWVDTNVPNC